MTERDLLQECLRDQLAAADSMLMAYNIDVLDGVFSPSLRTALSRFVVAHCELREAVAGTLTERVYPRLEGTQAG